METIKVDVKRPAAIAATTAPAKQERPRRLALFQIAKVRLHQKK